MKIALAQIDIIAGNPATNVARMLKFIKESKEKGCDVVSFPEMSIGGYLVGDLWTDDNFCRNLMGWNDAIIAASHGITVVWGNVYLEERHQDIGMGIPGRTTNPKGIRGRDGRLARYNAAYVYRDGKPAERYLHGVKDLGSFLKAKAALPEGVAIKTNMPTYRFFDDQRYFLGAFDFWDLMGAQLNFFNQGVLWTPFIVPVNG